MNMTTLATGDPLQVRCSKCRKITSHIIVAMADGQPSVVQCNSCTHTSAARRSGERRSADPKKPERDEWAALRPEMDSSRAADYSMTAAYKVKSLVNHPVFGLGLVQRSAGAQKMVVLFADGEKIMRCK